MGVRVEVRGRIVFEGTAFYPVVRFNELADSVFC